MMLSLLIFYDMLGRAELYSMFRNVNSLASTFFTFQPASVDTGKRNWTNQSVLSPRQLRYRCDRHKRNALTVVKRKTKKTDWFIGKHEYIYKKKYYYVIKSTVHLLFLKQ